MSRTLPACFSTPEEAALRIDALPFESIPHQTKLFLDYLKGEPEVLRFYPTAVGFHQDVSARAEEVLSAHRTDRKSLCDALEALNRGWGCGDETIKNIARLREADAVAVVTGQQAGLFTGPLYTVYKALTAVKLARCLTDRGTKAVPVFWIATEDHDFAEVSTAEFIGCDCRLAEVSVNPSMHEEGTPVGSVRLDESITETIERLLTVLPETEFTTELRKLLVDSWRQPLGYGEAFARMMTHLMKDYGLVLLDPMDAKLKELAAPVYAEAALRAHEIARAIEARSRELIEAGYHAQVATTEDSFPLFLHTRDGARHAVTRTEQGTYRAKDTEDEYTAKELAEKAGREPSSFSPNVTLRAVVQDFLLPTIAYMGGAAEIAYFAQTAEVYRVLGRPLTPILPRASMTIVEHRTGRTLERYNLQLKDFFAGLDTVLARVVEEHLGTEAAETFDEAESSMERELDKLKEQLQKVDPTLSDALETGRKKIQYQLTGLRTRFHRAQMNRDRAAHRQIERAALLLYPHKSLQERHINITSLLARHGRYCINWIYDAINLSSHDHQVVYL